MNTLNYGDFLFDKYLNKAEKLLINFNVKMSNLASKVTPFCKERCSFCCRHMFFVSNAEIEVATNYLLNNELIYNSFVNKCKQRENDISKLNDVVTECNDKGEAGSNAAIKFMKFGIPCSFLENDLCSIYPIRPMACSSYVSIIPPSICKLEPKSLMTNRMCELYNENKKELKKLMKSIKINPNEFIDISHQVFYRLKELGRI